MSINKSEALNFKFNYKIPGYNEFKENIYKPEGWFGRKIVAIPKAIISGSLFTVYCIAKVVLFDLPIALFGNVKPLKETIFRFGRDIQLQFGRVVAIFNDRLGGYIQFSSYTHRAFYDHALSPKLIFNDFDRALRVWEGKGYLPKMIIKNLNNVNAVKSDDYIKDTLLMLAIRKPFWNKKDQIELVEALLSKGADMNAENKRGETALSIALDSGREEIAKLLTRKGVFKKLSGVNKKIGHFKSDTLLILAAKKGYNEQIEKLLEKGAKISEKDRDGKTALSIALEYGHEKTAELLIEKGALGDGADIDEPIDKYSNKTLLVLAAKKGFEKIVSKLIEEGAQVSKKVGDTTALYASLEGGHEKVALLLIKNGALDRANSINEKYGYNKRTLLMTASEKGCYKLVADLINRGAKVTKKNDRDETALSLAIGSKHEKVAELLIDNGAVDNDNDLNHEFTSFDFGGWWFLGRNMRKKTLLGFAVLNGLKQVVSKLLDKGAKIHDELVIAINGNRAEIIPLLISKGAKIPTENMGNNDFLMRAARIGLKDVVEQWIRQGGDVKAKGQNGSNALHYAAQNGHLELVKFLIEQGISVKSKGVNGKTALEFAKDSIGGKKEDKKKVADYLLTL